MSSTMHNTCVLHVQTSHRDRAFDGHIWKCCVCVCLCVRVLVERLCARYHGSRNKCNCERIEDSIWSGFRQCYVHEPRQKNRLWLFSLISVFFDARAWWGIMSINRAHRPPFALSPWRPNNFFDLSYSPVIAECRAENDTLLALSLVAFLSTTTNWYSCHR